MVTGASSGVGRAVAKGCALAGFHVVLVSRDQRRGEAVVQALAAETGSGELEWQGADLGDLDSVRDLAERIRGAHESISILSNNAAALSLGREESPQGLERTIATNYLGHALLARLLVEPLSRGAPSRVITVSGHPRTIARARLDFDDLTLRGRYSALRATLNAALARVLFTVELAERLESRSIAAYTFHPGFVRSSLPSNLPFLPRILGMAAMRLLSPECPTGVMLAVEDTVPGPSGSFFLGRKAVDFRPGYDVRSEARRLWAATESLL